MLDLLTVDSYFLTQHVREDLFLAQREMLTLTRDLASNNNLMIFSESLDRRYDGGIGINFYKFES